MSEQSNTDPFLDDSPLVGPLDRAEILVSMLIDDYISDVEFTELSGMLNTSADTRRLYVDTMSLHVDLLNYFAIDDNPATQKPLVLGFLGDLMPLDPHRANDGSAN